MDKLNWPNFHFYLRNAALLTKRFEHEPMMIKQMTK